MRLGRLVQLKLAGLLAGACLLLIPSSAAAQVTMTLTPNSVTLDVNLTQDFTAVIAGTNDKSVNKWKVCDGGGGNCVLGGNATVGTIVEIGADGSGNPIARYTAPAVTPTPPACAAAPDGCQVTIKAIKKLGPGSKVKAKATVTIEGLLITTASLAGGVQNVSYHQTLMATGGVPPYTWSLTSGALPDGLALDAGTGVISGTPTTTGTFNFTIEAADSDAPANTSSQAFSIVVSTEAAAGVTVALIPSAATVATTQTQDFTAVVTGTNNKSVNWKVCDANGRNCAKGGNSVVGTIVDTGGVDGSGNTIWRYTAPAAVPSPPACAVVTGGCQLTVKIIKKLGPGDKRKAKAPVTLTEGVVITTTSLPDAVVGVAYNQGLTTANGTPPLVWSEPTAFFDDASGAGSGACTGLTFDFLLGAISGTPAGAGTCGPFTAQVTDSAVPATSDTQSLSIFIADPLVISTTSLPNGTADTAYNQSLARTGGTGPFTWSLAGGSGPLPTGLSLSAAGVISGLPTTPGTFNFTVQVDDSGNPPQSDTQALSIVVDPAPLLITTSFLPSGVVGVAYNTQLSASGGTPPLTWSETTAFFDDTTGDGTGDCTGLTLDFAAGTISGTPAPVSPAPATCGPFTLQVDDSAAASDSTSLSITINDSLGRNDSIATATPRSNGTFSASISPFADPVDTNPGNPDTDYYEITANSGAIVTIEITAQRLPTASPLDSVIEILRPNGTRHTTCRNEGNDDGVTGDPDPTPTSFDDECLNDDIALGAVRDSKLEFLVPGPPGPVTFFVHVLDWGGSARPDFLYTITISGAN